MIDMANPQAYRALVHAKAMAYRALEALDLMERAVTLSPDQWLVVKAFLDRDSEAKAELEKEVDTALKTC